MIGPRREKIVPFLFPMNHQLVAEDMNMDRHQVQLASQRVERLAAILEGAEAVLKTLFISHTVSKLRQRKRNTWVTSHEKLPNFFCKYFGRLEHPITIRKANVQQPTQPRKGT